MIRLVNACPHDLTFYRPDGTYRTISKSGIVARAEEHSGPPKTIETNHGPMSVMGRSFGCLVGLPDEKEGVAYVVSAVAFQQAKLAEKPRQDLFMLADLVRDTEGRILGARALAR